MKRILFKRLRSRMIPLSYNTNGLRNIPLYKAIQEVSKAGYEGIELSLHSSHFHPFETSRQKLRTLKSMLDDNPVVPVCIAAGAADLLSSEPFEPSLISSDQEGRQQRIDLLCSTIDIAAFLSVPVVNFASGSLKKGGSPEKAEANLITAIKSCLKNVGDIILAIEPEPGMFIETTAQAISLIGKIGSAQLRLNLDIGHVQCCEDDLLGSISRSLSLVRHIHIEDIKAKVHHHEIPGEGNLDFRSIFRILKDSSYQYYLSVELYHHADDWERALRQSRQHLLEEMKLS